MADIARADVAGLIPDEYSNSFLEQITAASAALSTFRVIRVGTKTTTLPVIATLPSAGFVAESATESDGVKPTTEMTWANQTITVEEVACIVPVHENVIADSSIDLWAQIRPAVAEAFGVVIDGAIFYGTGKPSSWRAGLIPSAASAGQAAVIDTGDDVLDAFNTAFGYVEQAGFDVNTIYSGPAMKARLRGLRNADGQFLYLPSVQGGTDGGSVYGASVQTVRNGVWNDAVSTALVADSRRLVVALREDMEYRMLDQATVGGINLAERDMVALRVKMRLGWEVQAPVTRLDSSPVPFATVLPGAGGS